MPAFGIMALMLAMLSHCPVLIAFPAKAIENSRQRKPPAQPGVGIARWAARRACARVGAVGCLFAGVFVRDFGRGYGALLSWLLDALARMACAPIHTEASKLTVTGVGDNNMRPVLISWHIRRAWPLAYRRARAAVANRRKQKWRH